MLRFLTVSMLVAGLAIGGALLGSGPVSAEGHEDTTPPVEARPDTEAEADADAEATEPAAPEGDVDAEEAEAEEAPRG